MPFDSKTQLFSRSGNIWMCPCFAGIIFFRKYFYRRMWIGFMQIWRPHANKSDKG